MRETDSENSGLFLVSVVFVPPFCFVICSWACPKAFVRGRQSIGTFGCTTYVWTYKKFDIGYNGDQIVDINLTSDGKVLLEPNVSIAFSFEVNWVELDVSFKNRFDKYLDPNFFQHRIHWFSIFNSFMMVIFLVGLVSMIMMRTLRRDYARYSKDEDLDDLERDLGDEYGWKQVHGDVFRSPPWPILFSSLVGTGCQLALVACACILLAILEHVYEQRGTLMSITIFVYSGFAWVNGFSGAALYTRFGGRQWIKQMLTSAFFLPVIVGGSVFMVNFIAIYYHASRAIPLTPMAAVVAICLFVIFPLQLVGTLVGRNLSGQANFPCCVNTVPRPIPEKEVVHGALCDCPPRWHPPFWLHLYRGLLHLHLLLGLQDLLCVRVHVPCVLHPPRGHGVCHHRLHLLSPQLRGLSLAVDQLPLGSLHRALCVRLLILLLLLQDQDVRVLSDGLLLHLHGPLQPLSGSDVWHNGVHRSILLRAQDIPKRQD